MRRSGLFLTVLGVSLVMLSSVFAEDSSDLFLKAYRDFQAGEKLEREAKPQEALKKYRSAQQVLRQIAKSAPDWQPLVVEYRLRKTQESVTRLEASSASTSLPEPLEGDMPEPEPEKEKSPPASSAAVPVVRVNPPSTPKRTEAAPRRAAPPEENFPAGRSSIAAERELRDLRRQLAQARAENEAVNERFLKKSAELQSALVEIDKTKVNVVELKAQLAQATASLENVKKDGVSLTQVRENLEKKYSGVVDQYADLQTQNEVLQEENQRLLAKLEKASKYIAESDKIRASLLAERKELDSARDQALAKVKRIKDNSEEIDRISKENKELKSDLAEMSESTVSKGEYEKLTEEKKLLTAKQKASADEIAAKNEAIASLQSDLQHANEKLLEAQARISQGDDELNQLRQQVDEAWGQLARFEANPDDEKRLAMENELLRGIILRQIKEQTQRDDAIRLIQEEIAALNANSDLVKQQLAVLETPVVQLTPEEHSVFKEPVSLVTESNDQSLEVTVAISKQNEAEVTTKRVLQDPPEHDSLSNELRQLAQQAKNFFEAKKFDEAEKIYRQIVEKAPDNYVALTNLGVVQIEGGKPSDAAIVLEKAVGINGKDSSAYTNLGIAYSRQGKFDEAIGVLNKAISFNESDPVAHNYLGVCLGQEEQWNEAEIQLRRAIQLKPEYSDAHFNLAVLYASTQPPSLERAKEHYAKATALGAAPDASLERLIQ
jgi:Flp pilus assembly protein TadD